MAEGLASSNGIGQEMGITGTNISRHDLCQQLHCLSCVIQNLCIVYKYWLVQQLPKRIKKTTQRNQSSRANLYNNFWKSNTTIHQYQCNQQFIINLAEKSFPKLKQGCFGIVSHTNHESSNVAVRAWKFIHQSEQWFEGFVMSIYKHICITR